MIFIFSGRGGLILETNNVCFRYYRPTMYEFIVCKKCLGISYLNAAAQDAKEDIDDLSVIGDYPEVNE